MREHGESYIRTKEYIAYINARRRCEYPKYSGYKYYGAKGTEFRFSCFSDFLKEVGRKPSRKHTLGRINTEGHYEPGNVRWETWTEQSRNRPFVYMTMAKVRRIRWLYDNTSITQRELAKKFNTSQNRIWEIVNNVGWKDVESC